MKTLLTSIAFAATVVAGSLQAQAQTVLYNNDYEDQTVVGSALNGNDDDSKAWRGKYWQIDGNRVTRVSVQKDDAHGKYISLQQRNSLWATGGAVMRFYDTETASSVKDRFAMADNNITNYTVEFDAAIKETAAAYLKGGTTITQAGCNAEICLIHSEANLPKNLTYGYTYGNTGNESDNIFFMKGNNDVALPETETIPWTEANMEFTLFTDDINLPRLAVPVDGTWCHYKIDVDRTKETVSYTITPENGTAITGNYTVIEGSNLILQGIYVRISAGSKDNTDYISLDNIKVTNNSSTDGISTVKTSAQEEDVYYTISGMKTTKPVKGVNIYKGKKIIIR